MSEIQLFLSWFWSTMTISTALYSSVLCLCIIFVFGVVKTWLIPLILKIKN